MAWLKLKVDCAEAKPGKRSKIVITKAHVVRFQIDRADFVFMRVARV